MLLDLYQRRYKTKNVEARVVLPLYSSIDREKYNLQYKQHIFIDLGWRHIYCGIFETEVNGVTYYFIDNEHYLIEVVYTDKMMMVKDLHSFKSSIRNTTIIDYNQIF